MNFTQIKRIILLIILFLTFNLKAQHEQDYWIFGHRNESSDVSEGTPAMIDFNPLTGPSPAFGTLNTSANPNPPNNITIADNVNLGLEGTGVATHPQTGELLFYTDGNFVYNGSHDNITPLSGTLGGNNSNGQPVALCIDPGDCSQNTFYIFSNSTGLNGQSYQNGKITYRKYNSDTESFSSQQELPLTPTDNNIVPNMTEGTLIIPSNTNPNLFWLIAHIANSTEIRVYEINPTGILTPQTYDLGPNHDQNTSSIGNIAYTVNGDQGKGKIAFINNGFTTSKVFTLDIDLTTGVISDPTTVINNAGSESAELDYDVEFSPNGSKLYITTLHSGLGGALYQYDFSTQDMNEIVTHQRMGGVKLGPDNNVYYLYTLPHPDGTYGGIDDMYGSGIGRITTPDLISDNNSFAYDDDWDTHLGILGINFPEFITMPAMDDITLSSSKVSICAPETFTLSINIGNLNPTLIENYDIFLDGNLLSTVASFPQTLNQIGEYYVVVNLTNGCIRTAPILISTGNCCTAATDPLFQTITTNISTDTYWYNKIYIPDNTTLIVDGAVLDITTVDVVFGECSGINFINGATLRANNSVFRSCSIDGTWKGLSFDGKQESEFDNQINESTFKNAEAALYFSNQADGLISNNLFSNCNQGIRVENNRNFNHTISGNRFVTEEFFPEYTNCLKFTNTSTYGIYAHNAIFTSQISQNDFLETLHKNIVTTGIEQIRSSSIISNNIFTDMNSSINVVSPQGYTSINNNMFEINTYSEHSIFVEKSSSNVVEINDNTLLNDSHDPTPESAILVQFSNFISITNNSIEGYQVGINILGSDNVQISQNNLSNPRKYGILFDQKDQSDKTAYITCNQIRMNDFKGMGLRLNNISTKSQITSNCIFDSRYAMFLTSNHSANLPLIRNNYLYNYQGIGIRNHGYEGNIGTTNDPGLNTFWSNNSSVTDIYSTNNIVISENFGVFNFSQTVEFLSKKLKYSTASCANQIYGYEPQDNLNTNYICDNTKEIFNTIQGKLKNPTLVDDFKELLKNSDNQFDDISLIMNSISGTDLIFLDEMIAVTKLNNNEIYSLKYNYHFNNKDYFQAKSNLEKINPSSELEHDFYKLRLINLK